MAHHAPATSGIFSFAGDSLFVEAAGNNLHRRATVPKLRAQFDASDDRPAHWYEAQLIHYGLPSSRVKGTSKMRLYDAVKKGDMAVPAYMKTMEKNLKKVWQDGAAASAAATRKRKAGTQTNVPVAKAPRKTQAASRGGATWGLASGEEVSILSASVTLRASQTARQGGSTSAAGRSFGPQGYDPHPSYLGDSRPRPIICRRL
ncbi:uncharacterized protein DNG_09142 [Cephalotrichum gorgonifer]|uniref:Uncharacterized protein n=1 Tax=Cephalotrichum gorgonifer TaxID=2041049 RepID=A0AAE8SZV8_9PEZI|nr:uncharacterized protein DNG_09142 [Cephalotrichum gorgonifer]